MAANRFGGGAATNANGLRFEQQTRLADAFVAAGYTVDPAGNVYANGRRLGQLAEKYKLYTLLLSPMGVNASRILSKRLLPDEAFFNMGNNTVYIIEKKFQQAAGSVDEKLQTCDFKKKQYLRLFRPLGIAVEYYYVCNDYFRQESYRDVFAYIEDVGCRYFFGEIPLAALGLPVGHM